MQTISVLIADDNEIIRAGVRQLLSRAPDFEVVGEAHNGREAIELASSLRPDVVLMDLRMPECDGASAARCILAEQPAVKIVVVTSDDSAYAERLAKAFGAVGVVAKDECVGSLIPKLRAVVDGTAQLTPSEDSS